MSEFDTRWSRAFDAFDRDNPNVYSEFDRMACDLLRRGCRRYSANAILHAIVYLTPIKTNGDPFKINMNFGAYYARKWRREHPSRSSFFRLRELRSLAIAA